MFNKVKREKARLKDLELKDKFKDIEFEKNDALAMFIAAVLTLVLPIIAIVAFVCILIWIIF